ncbi:hypothetical protein OROHE_014472 [Orobanche hederae]
MGSCFSKKNACKILDQPKTEIQLENKKTEEVNLVKKEIFVIKHRNSHEIQRQERSSDEEKSEPKKPDFEKGKNVISCNGSDGNGVGGGAPPVRTSSCTKEEVDAILIQCGRLSRSYSTGKAASLSSESGGRKYSGSKRSYDFDSENGNEVGEDTVFRERENRRIERRRESPMRRRTLSSEREQQRSGSRERGGGSGGRRVSRSPGRRSESPIKNSNSYSSAALNGNSRPGKMVSVPATNKINNAAASGDGGAGEVKRIEVKRNVGGSPRARSPARMRGSNENMGQNQQLSRSNSRKAEHSPHRRNPLAEIDTSTISQKPNAENKIVQVSENRNNNLITTNANCKNHQEHNHPMSQEAYGIPGLVALSVISSSSSSSGPENLKNQPLTRTRSSRRSRDLDINPKTLSNSNTSSSSSSSYTALLLEDIQNFHHKNTPPPPAFILPPCVIKACSILEAVADLNFSPGSNQSQTSKINKSKPEINKDPILESEVLGKDDLMEPSFHKYVTVRRGGGTSGGEEDMEDQESSGSNSFVTGIGQQHWVSSSSCWEPNSADRVIFSASS